ncbi:hypothetical protein E2C01_046092 [Portunus trituberculatus]|uniref:Uncharacterized protein n=1 Tax=Portunus trituberculatus TaxID=210409 RepID=A0A5B7G3V4_PORTR|nr:hypothetical protein [Portunus trituberculatus]
MADSDVRGSEMPEGSQPGLKRLENLVAGLVQAVDKMAQEISENKEETSKIKQETNEISEIKQETSAEMRMDLMREEMLAAFGGGTVEHGKRLRQDLTKEFKEELVAVRQQCEGHTEFLESKVEEVREEVTRLRHSMEKQSLGTWGQPECPEPTGQGHPYASSEPGNVGCCGGCGGRTRSTHLWYAPAPKDDVITLQQSLPPPSDAGSTWHIGGTSVQPKPAEFGEQVAWEAYQAHFELLAQGQGWSNQEKPLQLMASLCGPVLEILAHMMASQRSTYTAVSEALRRRFGSVF